MLIYSGVEHPSGSGSGLRLSAERIRRAFVLGGRGNSSNAAEGEADRAPIMSQQQDIVSSEDYGETTDDELIGKLAARPDSSTIQFLKSPLQGNSNYVFLDKIGHNWKWGSWDWIQFLTLQKPFVLFQPRNNPTPFSIKRIHKVKMNPVQHENG